MCSILVTTKPLSDFEEVNKYLKLRGPDLTNKISINNINFVHNLLHMTGEKQQQPFIDEDVVCLFNGEIYNYKSFGDFSTDGECLIPLYKEYGANFVQHLDGEYCVCLIDFKNDLLLISSDVFSTKPIWYSFEQDHFGIASYESALKMLGFESPTKLKANTTETRKLSSFLKTLTTHPVYEFDLKQYKTSFDDWTSAFQEAIRKRYATSHQKVFIGLSSGYDSGAICCELLRQGVDFHAYSSEGYENMSVLTARHKLLNDSIAKGFVFRASHEDKVFAANHLKTNVEDFPYRISSSSSGYKEYGSVRGDAGSNALAVICNMAKENDRKIYISGQGADEITSDYGFAGRKKFQHSNFGGLFPENLKEIFPWNSFYESSQLSYLMKEEYISGSFGLEGRYPYLDKDVVQEFLNLDHHLKNGKYKAPIFNYLTEHQFPTQENEKRGFSL